jgi:molecular chaperone DnaK (HSP70)
VKRTVEVGFDFGTTTTMVAYGDRVSQMPSMVGYDATGTCLFGIAEERMDHSLRSIKRAITHGHETVQVRRGTIEPADPLMVGLLSEAVRRAEDEGFPIRKPGAVRLGCPAMWTVQQRNRLVSIAQKAGLPVTADSMVDEPVAAGIAWLSGDTAPRPSRFRMLVFDMGGGTLDVAVMDVRERREVTVLSAVGHGVAGDNLDARIVNRLVDKLDEKISPFAHPSITRELRWAAREIKEGLSGGDPKYFFQFGPRLGRNIVWFSRYELDKAFEPLMNQALTVVSQALERAGHATASSIDVVILAGGMTRVPYLYQRVDRMFGPTVELTYAYPPTNTASQFGFGYSPEDAISVGLAQADRYGHINLLRPANDNRLAHGIDVDDEQFDDWRPPSRGRRDPTL